MNLTWFVCFVLGPEIVEIEVANCSVGICEFVNTADPMLRGPGAGVQAMGGDNELVWALCLIGLAVSYLVILIVEIGSKCAVFCRPYHNSADFLKTTVS